MFKKKVTYDEVCRLIISQASEICVAALKSMEEQLTSLDDNFNVPDPDRGELDVMLAVVALELRVAVNKLKKSEAEKIAKGVYELFAADGNIGEYSTHELDLYDKGFRPWGISNVWRRLTFAVQFVRRQQGNFYRR